MVKTAPHFGHLTFVSLDTPAHPKEKTAKSANAKKMLINFLMIAHLLSSSNMTVPFPSPGKLEGNGKLYLILKYQINSVNEISSARKPSWTWGSRV